MYMYVQYIHIVFWTHLRSVYNAELINKYLAVILVALWVYTSFGV